MRSRLRAFLLSAAALLGFAFVASTYDCVSNQGEGERCLTNDDCSSGLTCLSQTVCCPPDPKTSSSPDCRNQGGTVVDSGTPDTVIGDTAPADTGATGTDAVGHTCKYTSDCPAPLVCLPGGTCGYQCIGNRDCAPGDHCDCPTFTCIAGTTGGADNCLADSGAPADTEPADTTPADTGADTTLDDTFDASLE